MLSEIRGQLRHVLSFLARDFYHPIEQLKLMGFVDETDHSYTLAEAARFPRTEKHEGEQWGKNWQYMWLFTDIVIPESARGERIVMKLNPGGESTLFLNGHPYGTRRANTCRQPHHLYSDQMLTDCAVPGEKFEVAMEVYGGTPLPAEPCRERGSGPIAPEEGVPMVIRKGIIGECSFGIWNEEAYQLWLDMDMLMGIHDCEPDNSSMKEAINEAMCRLLNEIDFELPLRERRAACVKAREILRPVMEARNGTFAPSMSVIANSHLDVEWLWPLAETRRKVARTFAGQLRMLEKYPEARFLQSQAFLYELCRQYYPDLFEELKKAVKDGRWIIEGAMWVEPDTNLAGGEAIIRQILYGKRFFREHFDVDCKVAWLPDSFGYSAALPQILTGCGMNGLTTQKIFWSYNDGERFPYHGFNWRGLDGTEVNCYLHMGYETAVDVKTVRKRWDARLTKDGTGEFFLPFGYGDGGGGPTRDDLEQIRRMKDLQGAPRMRYEAPEDFFVRRTALKKPTYVGELYFQCHRGTYTTQALVKKNNRRSEQLLRALEIWNSLAALKHGSAPVEQAQLDEMWKNVLLNQFHDILPGSAMHRVYVETNDLYARTLAKMEGCAAQAVAALTEPGEGVTFFNAQSVPVTRVVQLDDRFAEGAAAADGTFVPYAPTVAGAEALVTLPPMGSLSLVPAESDPVSAVTAEETEKGYVLKNSRVTALLNEKGELVSFVLDGRERITAPSNRFALYRDIPRNYDAWDIDSQTFDRPVDMQDEVTAEVGKEDGLSAFVTFTHSFLNSSLIQTVVLEADAVKLDFVTHADWHERHRLLKVGFTGDVQTDEAENQIQFGYVKRPTHASRVYDADRFEVCNMTYTALRDETHGVALLNDSKYGIRMTDKTLALSLLRGATNPDESADQGEHDFIYSWYAWDGAADQVVHQANQLNVPLLMTEGIAPAVSYISVSDPAVVAETLKLAEDGSGDLILRLYESRGASRRAFVQLPAGFASAVFTDLNEQPLAEPVQAESDRALVLEAEFHPFQIVTVRLKKA